MYNPKLYDTKTEKIPQLLTTTEAQPVGQTNTGTVTAAISGPEIVLPSDTSKGTFSRYPTTRVDVRKTTIARKTQETLTDAARQSAAVKEIEGAAVAESEISGKEVAKEGGSEGNNSPASYWGTVYSNGYPYDNMESYQEYLKKFYASEGNQEEPTKGVIKTGKH